MNYTRDKLRSDRRKGWMQVFVLVMLLAVIACGGGDGGTAGGNSENGALENGPEPTASDDDASEPTASDGLSNPGGADEGPWDWVARGTGCSVTQSGPSHVSDPLTYDSQWRFGDVTVSTDTEILEPEGQRPRGVENAVVVVGGAAPLGASRVRMNTGSLGEVCEPIEGVTAEPICSIDAYYEQADVADLPEGVPVTENEECYILDPSGARVDCLETTATGVVDEIVSLATNDAVVACLRRMLGFYSLPRQVGAAGSD